MSTSLSNIPKAFSCTSGIERYKIFSGSALKLIACISMFCDHLAKYYLSRFVWANTVWFSIAGRCISFNQLMIMFGRFAIPIFAFLIVVGFEHTRSKVRYGLSLFILALLSEIPFNLMVGQSLFLPKQNVIFTWLLGFLSMWSMTYFKQKPLISLAAVVALYLVSRYFQADGRVSGFLFILLMYGLRNNNVLRCVVPPALLQMKAMVFLSLLLTCMYNGKRGFINTPVLKYAFYAFYPVHMLLIYCMSR